MRGVLRVHGVVVVPAGGVVAGGAGDDFVAEAVVAVAIRDCSVYGEEGGGRSRRRVRIRVRVHLYGEVES